jgi:hypothetical protein
MFNISDPDADDKSKKQPDYSSSALTSEEFRCIKCNKLLARKNMEGKISGQIKCTRCGTVNEI